EVAWGYRAVAEISGAAADFAAAEKAFREAIAAGENSDGPSAEAANLARMDLGEMLAQRGQWENAMDAFTAVLDAGGEPWLMGKAQVHIAQCLLSKGDLWGAIREAQGVGRSSGRMIGQARYLMGEAYLQMKDWKKGAQMLRVFEDQANYFNAPEVGDK